jgi:hypothetical protein
MLGLGLGVVASQAGHLLAYELRYGGAAPTLQSSGAHAYFPLVAKTGLGAAAAVMLLGLLAIGLARLAAGRPIPQEPGPSFLRLLGVLYSLQLTCFVVQETVEAAVGGAPASSPAALLLWGTVGQLPVAMVAALALRWLVVRLRPALAQLLLPVEATYQRFVWAVTPRAFSLATEVALSSAGITTAFNRRGPPL